ncbi:MAG: indole-3-glycerol phosphate synthase TrpC [Alphaproteobacteria bacterium]|nr:indole-3-glycerol phosphate synthase TrpC [Alphaproteobacteria bacterium]
MASALERICADKRRHVAARKRIASPEAIEDAARAAPPPRGFLAALRRAIAARGFGLIAEVKRASPSKGLIRADFDPAKLARAYEQGGAACVSVLTDAPYFQGEDADLVAARTAAAIPVLRKDFMLDPYQIAEARALGADCVLLILAALDDDTAKELEIKAMSFGMDVLIEVHDAAELDRALRLKSPLVGVNNRDLKTLKTDLGTTRALARHVPPDRLLVAESGLYTATDLAEMAALGARSFLIGEALMREPDVEVATRSLLDGTSALRRPGSPEEWSR